MKIFKSKVVAVVLTLAMVFSVLAVPVAAAEQAAAPEAAKVVQPATKEDAAKFLADKALLQGDENGDLMLGSDLTREQMVVILSRLMGVEEEAMSYPVDNLTFTDVPLEDEYAPYIAWAYDNMITQGYDEETFGFGEKLTTEQTKLFFVRVLGYTDLSDEEQLTKADELNITAGSTAADAQPITRADMALLMSNTVFATTSEGKVLGEEIGVLEKEEVVPPVVTPEGATEVSSVTVTAEDAMKVVFNGAVADTTAAKFEVTGAMIVTPTVTWNDAKTEATLKSAGIFLDGTYTVKVTGVTLTAGKDSATVVVAKNGVAKIEILGDKLVRTGDETGTVKIKLTDSYGNDVTEKLAYDVELRSSRGTATITDPKKGIVTFDIHDAVAGEANDNWKDYPITPELVTLTVYSKNVVGSSIATANAVLTVTEKSKVDKVELSNVVLPTGVAKLTLDKASAGYIVVKAKDQFGGDITDINVLATPSSKIAPANQAEENALGVFYSVGDTAIKNKMELKEETNAAGDKEFRLYINLDGIKGRDNVKQVTVQTISKGTGSSSNVVTLDLKEGKVPYRLTLGAQSQVVAVGDQFDANIVIPMFVYDEDGVQLTADEIADNATKFEFDSGAQTFFGLKVATSGENKGKIVGTTMPDAKGTQTIIVKITGSITAPATTTVDVKDTAEARSIKLRETPATNLLYNSEVKYSYDFVDQYGRVMEDSMLDAIDVTGTANDRAKTEVKLTLSDATKGSAQALKADSDGTPGAPIVPTTILTDGTTIVDASTLVTDDSVLVAALQKNGSFSLKAELLKPATANVISTLDKSFSVAEGVPSSLAFAITTVPTIKGLTVGSGLEIDTDTEDTAAKVKAAGLANIYAKELEVTAKDANGNTFAVPADRILSVKSSDETIAVADVTGGSIMMYGLASAFQPSETVTTKTVTVTIQVGTDTEAKSINTTVTVSKDAPRVQQVLFIDKDLTATSDKLPTGYKEVKEVTLNSHEAFYIVTKDQYGIYKKVGVIPNMTVVNKDKVSGAVFNFDGAKLVDEPLVATNVPTVIVNSTIVLMYSEDGAYGTINVRTGNLGVTEF